MADNSSSRNGNGNGTGSRNVSIEQISNKVEEIKNKINQSSNTQIARIEDLFSRCQLEIATIIDLLRPLEQGITKLLESRDLGDSEKTELKREIERLNADKFKIFENLEEILKLQQDKSAKVDSAISLIDELPNKITALKNDIERITGRFNPQSNPEGPIRGGKKAKRATIKRKLRKNLKKGGTKKRTLNKRKSNKRKTTQKGGYNWKKKLVLKKKNKSKKNKGKFF